MTAALSAGAQISVTVRMNPAVKRSIAVIPDAAWETIHYTDAIYDEAAGTLVSSAKVAETLFVASTSQKKADSRKKAEQVPGRLVVRGIPELNPKAAAGQGTLFDQFRFHAFFTTTGPAELDTVAAGKTHRQHAVIEQVNADLKDSALAHLLSGHFGANSAWRVAAVMAYNLTRAAGILASGSFAKARTATVRRKLILVPARIATSARRIRLRMPESWPWQAEWERLFAAVRVPPQAV